MKNIALLLVSISLVILATSCHKNDIPVYGLTDQQKAFSAIKEGSYWIMRDSISGRVDSFAVTSVSDGSIHSSNGNEGDYIVEERIVGIEGYNNAGIKTGFAWGLSFFGKGSQLLSGKWHASTVFLPHV